MKQTWLAFIFLFFHISLFGQQYPDSTTRINHFSFRLMIGANASMMDKFGPYREDYGNKKFRILPGSNYGIGFNYRIFKFLKLGLGVQVSNYGGSFYSRRYIYVKSPGYVQQTQNYSEISHNYRLSYLEIPFTFKVNIHFKNVQPFLEGGISYARLMDAYYFSDNATNYTVNFYVSQPFRNNISNLVEKHNFYYLLGTGVDFRANKKFDFQILCRFSNSITRVFSYDLIETRNPETDELVSVDDMVTHLRTIQLIFSTGYNF